MKVKPACLALLIYETFFHIDPNFLPQFNWDFISFRNCMIFRHSLSECNLWTLRRESLNPFRYEVTTILELIM